MNVPSVPGFPVPGFPRPFKIDQSFIRNLDSSSGVRSGNGAIVQAIVTLAQQLGLRVVAEGVETDEELEMLRRLGCTDSG